MGRIVVVDDDEISAVGAKVVLKRIGFDAAETGWKDLHQQTAAVGEIDLLIAVVRRDPTTWDRYRSLHEAGDLRTQVPAGTRIVAVTGVAESTNPLLGLRLHQAGVDDMVTVRHIQSVERIAALASGQMVGIDPRPTPEALAPAFVGRRSDPTQVIELINRMAMRDVAYLRAFTPGLRQGASGLTRRRAHTLRVKIAKLGDLSPDPARRTGGPVRDESVPRWAQVVPFVNQIRGWRPEDEIIELSDERGTSGQPRGQRPVFSRVG